MYVSDSDLLQSIKNDDAAAFKVLYDRYWESLYLKACKRGDKDEAKDLVQEVMTTLWRRRNEIITSEDGQLSRYLHTAIKYRVISYYAYSATVIHNGDLFDNLINPVQPNELEAKEFSEFLEEEIKRLPARMQQIFRLSREEDLSISDIAHRLNLSEQTIKNQLSEALKRIRASVQEHQISDWILMLILFYYTSGR